MSNSKILSTLTQTPNALTKQLSDITVQSTGIVLSSGSSSTTKKSKTVKSSSSATTAAATTPTSTSTTSTEASSLPADEIQRETEEVENVTVATFETTKPPQAAPVPGTEEEDDMNLGISSSCIATLCG